MERAAKQADNSEAMNSRSIAQTLFASPPTHTRMTSAIDNSPFMAAQRKALQGMFGNAVQLQEADDELLQGRFEQTVQRVDVAEPTQRIEKEKFRTVQREADEKELFQGKFEAAPQAADETEVPQTKLASESPIQLIPPSKSNDTGLPDNLKAGAESLSGISLDDVRVHYNSSQPAQLNALAYAQGADIHVGPGQEKHLPHEAWHVVQQAHGRVKPTMQLKDGVPVNDDQGLEHEADVMGRTAATCVVQAAPDAPAAPRRLSKNEISSSIMQCRPFNADEIVRYFAPGAEGPYDVVIQGALTRTDDIVHLNENYYAVTSISGHGNIRLADGLFLNHYREAVRNQVTPEQWEIIKLDMDARREVVDYVGVGDYRDDFDDHPEGGGGDTYLEPNLVIPEGGMFPMEI